MSRNGNINRQSFNLRKKNISVQSRKAECSKRTMWTVYLKHGRRFVHFLFCCVSLQIELIHTNQDYVISSEEKSCEQLSISEVVLNKTWWRHEMETFSALLAICAGNSPVTGEFHAQRPVTRSFDIFFDLSLNKRLNKQSWGWWYETPSRPLWRHCNKYVNKFYELSKS